MGRHRWFLNLGGHYEAPEPLDRTGPATCYPNRSGALPPDSGDRALLDADHPWAEGASHADRVSRNRSRHHRHDQS